MTQSGHHAHNVTAKTWLENKPHFSINPTSPSSFQFLGALNRASFSPHTRQAFGGARNMVRKELRMRQSENHAHNAATCRHGRTISVGTAGAFLADVT